MNDLDAIAELNQRLVDRTNAFLERQGEDLARIRALTRELDAASMVSLPDVGHVPDTVYSKLRPLLRAVGGEFGAELRRESIDFSDEAFEVIGKFLAVLACYSAHMALKNAQLLFKDERVVTWVNSPVVVSTNEPPPNAA